MERTSNADAARLQQISVRLIADSYEAQLQEIANELAAAAETDRQFRVHLLNDNSRSIFSFPSGDIFISAGYVEVVVTNRDEMAFAIAREIAAQVEQVDMKREKMSLILRDEDNKALFVTSLVTSITINTVYSHFVTGPIDKAVMKSAGPEAPLLIGVKSNPPTVSSGRTAGGLMTATQGGGGLSPRFAPDPQFAEMGKNVDLIVGQGLNWLPQLISDKVDAGATHILEVAATDSDPDSKHWKDQHGLQYMRRANFDDNAGRRVIDRLATSGVGQKSSESTTKP